MLLYKFIIKIFPGLLFCNGVAENQGCETWINE